MPSVSAGIGGTRCAAMDSLSEGSRCEMELGSSSSEPQEQLGESPSPGKQDRLGDSTSPSCLSAAMSDAEGDAQLEGSDGCPSESLSDGQGGALGEVVRWRPGLDCGTFVGPDFVTWGITGQVFAANVYTSLRRVPAAVCRNLLGHLGFPLPRTCALTGVLRAFSASAGVRCGACGIV